MFSSLTIAILDAVLDLWPGAHGALASEDVRLYLLGEGITLSRGDLEARLNELAQSHIISVQRDATLARADPLAITGINGRVLQ